MSTGTPIYLDLFTGYSGTFVRSIAGRWNMQGNYGFNGGTCVLKIDTHEIANGFADLIVPGRHTLVARVPGSNIALGEWVLTRTTWESDGQYLSWEGKSWKNILGQHTAWRASGKSSGATSGATLATCLNAVARQHGLSLNLSVLTSLPTMSVEWKSGSSIGSTISEVTSGPNPPRWISVPVVNETGGIPTTVSRNIRIGAYKDLMFNSDYHFVGAGTTGVGNATVTGGYDWEKYVSYCIGFGAGSNDKQVSASKADGTLATRGVLNRDLIHQWSTVEDKAQLQRLVDGAVADGQDMSVSSTAILKLSEWSGIGLPRPACKARLTVHPCTGWPDGYSNDSMGITDVDFSASNGTVDSMTCHLEEV